MTLKPDDRETGIHIIGTSRRGKSKQIELLERQKFEMREGGLLIDPHGELYDNMERWLAANQFLLRRRKIRFLDPAAHGIRFGINPLRVTDEAQISNRAYAMLAAFSKMWGSENLAQMPTFQRCFVGLVYAVISKELTLLELPEAIPANRKALRGFLRQDLPDSTFDIVWEDFEVLQQSTRDWRGEFLSTMNRVTQFLTSDVIRETVGQRRNVIDWRACMDEGEYIILNLQPRGSFTASHATMLGRLIVHELFDLTIQRPKTARRPFHITIDECAALLSDDIPAMLPQTAKFGVHLTLAHQYLGQLKQESNLIYEGVMEQAPAKIVFGVRGFADAAILAPYVFAGEYDFERPKHVLDKPVVVGHKIIELSSSSESEGSKEGGGSSHAHSDGFVSLEGGSESTTKRDRSNEEIRTAQISGSHAKSLSWTSAEQSAWACTRSSARGTQEALAPVYQTMPTATYSKDEIEHQHAAEIMSQLKRHAVFRPSDPARPTERYQVPTVEEGTDSQRRIDTLRRTLLERTGFITAEQARAEIEERRAQILLPLLEIDGGSAKASARNEVPADPDSWRE
ncbi:MAG: hypothetical protein U1E42_00045 [Rhodospirillales bacterium]